MAGTVPAHWIKHNKAERVPSRFIILTVHAKQTLVKGKVEHSWLTGALHTGYWTNKGNLYGEDTHTEDLGTLWEQITRFTKERKRTVLYAHNLPFVMRISQALTWLPRKGFQLGAIRLSSQGTWSKWSRGEATLILCDTASVFTCSLQKLGEYCGVKRHVFDNTNYLASARSSCDTDCRILTTTVVQYLEWLKTGVAGNWGITGSTQSWNHYRHRHMTHKILVHDDSEAKLAERESMYSGRAENFRWGSDKTAPIYEYDFSNAYPAIAEEYSLPVRLYHSTTMRSSRQVLDTARRYAVLARGVVSTSVPVVPTRTERGIVWPVGEFEATLWDPEIRALVDAGGTFTPSRVWVYQKAPALRAWAQWCLGTVHDPQRAAYPWVPIVVKHWSRALIGRFALKYQDWELFGQAPNESVSIGTLYDRDTGELTDTMQIGREVRILTGFSDGDNACPQITSYVMSLARVKLWNVIQRVGQENVYYVDTDSVLVNATGRRIISSNSSDLVFRGLREKSRGRGYQIYGPKAIITGGVTKISGLPKGSERLTEQTFIGNVFSSLERSVQINEMDKVTVSEHKFKLRWNENRRARVSDGTTTPYELPGGRPSTPTGRRQPSTEDERTRYAVRALNAKKVQPDTRVPTVAIPLLRDDINRAS